MADPPEKPSFFSRIGVWLIPLFVASPLLLFGGMLVDLKGMFDQQQAGGAQNLESSIFIQGQRLQLEEEIEEEP